MLDAQATEPAKCSGGTRCGSMARLTGPLKDRTTPNKTNTANTAAIETEPRKVIASNSAKQVAKPTSQRIKRFLRLKRSATWPETRNKTMPERNCANQTSPRSSGRLESAYTCQPTATARIAVATSRQ